MVVMTKLMTMTAIIVPVVHTTPIQHQSSTEKLVGVYCSYFLMYPFHTMATLIISFTLIPTADQAVIMAVTITIAMDVHHICITTRAIMYVYV